MQSSNTTAPPAFKKSWSNRLQKITFLILNVIFVLFICVFVMRQPTLNLEQLSFAAVTNKGLENDVEIREYLNSTLKDDVDVVSNIQKENAVKTKQKQNAEINKQKIQHVTTSTMKRHIPESQSLFQMTNIQDESAPTPKTDKPIAKINSNQTYTVSYETCPELKRPDLSSLDIRNGIWQAQNISKTSDIYERIYGFRGYFDDRPILEGDVYIRLFTPVSSVVSRLLRKSQLWCYLWTNKLEHPVIILANKTISHGRRVIQVGKTIFVNWIISCLVPSELVKDNGFLITNVSLSCVPCGSSTMLLPVIYPPKPTTWTHTVGMCESNGVSFGFLKDDFAPWFIEWMEANIMFGITEFNIYNGTAQISKAVMDVIKYYEDQGLLIFHQHPPPLTGFGVGGWDLAHIGMRTSLNDCLYRNMYRYKYAAVIDLDEIIVPKAHDNYLDMLKGLDRSNQNYTKTYTFMARAFYETFTGNDSQKLNSPYPLKTSQYLKSIPDRRMKSFMNPRGCLGAFAHYCLTKIPDAPHISEYSGLAFVNHYRNTCLKPTGKVNGSFSMQYCNQWMQKQYKMDRFLYFADELYSRVLKVANLLNIPLG